MFIAVDDDGTLHDTAFTEFREKYVEHPDTHIKFGGYQIALVPKLIKAAIKMHNAIPQIGVINWDLTLGIDEEPILIEANTFGGSIWLFQMAHGKNPFGEKSEEILKWVKQQKMMRKSERNEDNGYGRMINNA